MKDVAVVFRRAPDEGDRDAEGLRNALGIAVERQNRVSVYFVAAAVPLLRLEHPGVRRAIAALIALRQRVVAEAEARAAAGVPCPPGVATMSRDRIYEEVTASDAVVAW